MRDPEDELQAAGLQDGDTITAVRVEPKAATERAFALWCPECHGIELRAYGHRDDGGDSSGVQDQLRNVQQIQATQRAFAAILANISVVTWGNPECGGESSGVQDRIKNVQQVQATDRAFVASLPCMGWLCLFQVSQGT